jgi:non-canonical (house-cleaning) NTP pyrophosphatase
MSSYTFYQHPDPVMRQAQEDARARARARAEVAAGRVRWNPQVGIDGGFVRRSPSGVDHKLALIDMIAMCELRRAGQITVAATGRVVFTAQKVSA